MDETTLSNAGAGGNDDVALKATYDDRVLAESVRVAEDLGASIDDPDVDARASAIDGTMEQKIIARATLLPASVELQRSLHHLRTVITLIVLVAVVLSIAAGAGAARTALGGQRDEPVIVLPVLGGLLGVQTLLLLAWLGLWVIRPRQLHTVSLGGLVLHALQYVSRLGTRSTEHLAAVHALFGVAAHGTLARWTTGLISHALWLAFNVGCFALLLLLLSTRDYTFGWETTILPDDAYAPLIRTIGWLPEQVGFTVPTEQAIADSRWTGSGPTPRESRHAWSSFLLGCIVVYGAAPRLAMMLLCAVALKNGQRRYRLDLSKPGFVRLRHRLQPQSTTTGIIDHDDTSRKTTRQHQAIDGDRPIDVGGAIPIVGFEIEKPDSGWPPRVDGVTFRNLGRIETRAERDHALQSLAESPTRPPMVMVVCAITTTPDRGVAAMLEQIRRAAGAPLTVALTAGQVMRQRGDSRLLANRLDDWRAMADEIDIPWAQVIEIDLDYTTDASLQQLARALGSAEMEAVQQRHIEQALAVIVEHFETWDAPPSDRQQLDLHTAVASLYRQKSKSWLARVHQTVDASRPVLEQATAGAKRSMSLLPGNLRASTGWAIAGATAGAVGCLAVASLITPAALAALPGWTAVGGALTTVLHAAQKLGRSDDSHTKDVADADPNATSQALAAATLFALLLDLQGRDETTISRVLEMTLPDDELPPAESAALTNWMDDLRHRYDLALAAQSEGGS